MSIRYKLIIAFSIVLCLAAGVAICGIMAITEAGDLVVQLYDEPFMAVSHARAAQVRFDEARAVMAPSLTAHDAQTGVGLVEAAVKGVPEGLGLVRGAMARGGTQGSTTNATVRVQRR